MDELKLGDIILLTLREGVEITRSLHDAEYGPGYWKILEFIPKDTNSEINEFKFESPSDSVDLYGAPPYAVCKNLNNGVCEIISTTDDPEFKISGRFPVQQTKKE
tara:strand:+ start:1923 stop:2237 length:315 start_codon:yes stop_codon:yes gene_type:complete